LRYIGNSSLVLEKFKDFDKKAEKEVVEKNLIFACGSGKINGVKKEVLECQFVTTS
jgi:hypothetical protein